MGRYCDWEDVIGRYPELSTIGDAGKVASSYIVYAESFVDGILRSHYATPFSESNMIVKDLCVDLVYWRAAGRKIEGSEAVWSGFYTTITLLKKGEMAMVDASGNVVPSLMAQPAAYSTTQSYHSAFGMDDPIDWSVDDDQIDADRDERL